MVNLERRAFDTYASHSDRDWASVYLAHLAEALARACCYQEKRSIVCAIHVNTQPTWKGRGGGGDTGGGKQMCGRLFEYYFVSKQLAPGYQHINSSERYAGNEVASCYVT